MTDKTSPARGRDAGATGGREPAAHPLAELFPLLEGEEFEDFKRDIARNGLLEPITLLGGLILDGRNRYRACRELGIEPVTVEWSGPGDAAAYVCSRNLHRRHLSVGRRAMIAASLATLGEGRPGETARIRAVSRAEAARIVGVGRGSSRGRGGARQRRLSAHDGGHRGPGSEGTG